MLTELIIKNFLSHKDTTIRFPKNATIAVVGDNGDGKSGLLEAIRFALYGDGRDDQRGLIRLGSTGGMFCAAILEDTPNKGQIFRVDRGVKENGSGYTKVYLNNVLVEKGGAKPSNNKAQDFIDGTLGVEGDTFGLTSFFGLGANDTLMKVRPAERLETLQKLADIDICKRFHKIANEAAKMEKEHIDKEKRAIEMINESLGDASGLPSTLKKLNAQLAKNKERHDAFSVKRSDLIREEKGFKTLAVERGKLQTSVENLEEKVYKLDRQMENLDSEEAQYESEIDDLSKKVTEAKAKIKGKSEESYTKKRDETIKEIARLKAEIELRAKGVNVDGEGKCPLCGSQIAEHSKEVWKQEMEQFTGYVTGATAIRDRLTKDRDLFLKYKNTAERGSFRLVGLREGLKKTEAVIKRDREIMSKDKTELSKKVARLRIVENKLKGYDALQRSLESLEDNLSELLTEKGTVQQSITNVRERIKAVKELIQKKRAIEGDIKQSTEEMLSYQVVAEAFSRYAIPVQLLRRLREAIEKRASRIYQEFGGGLIRIDDTGGSKPGVEFVLQDESGIRAYKVLSSGEQVMVFLSIRVAITQIINASRNNKIDFLILDEVAGNLSPSRRESLTKLINTFLKKFFPQIFMVSHVELRDIFDKTLHVQKDGGISHVL